MLDLTTLRQQFDEIDHQILALLTQRMELSQQTGAYKRAHGLPVYQPERRAVILTDRKTKATELWLDPTLIETIRTAIHDASLQTQQ